MTLRIESKLIHLCFKRVQSLDRSVSCLARRATHAGTDGCLHVGVAAVRPNFNTTFTDKLKVTVQTILTGSKANDLTTELSGADLQRYKKHIDETYEDFKNRVVEGRQIHPELINSLAGGRVYTGQMAYDLLAEEVERLKLDERKKKEAVDAAAVSEKSAGDAVQIGEDQSMSPYAPPETHIEAVVPSETKSVDPLDESELPELGPLGRGIIDGLGGIRDAAALAAEIYLVSMYQQAV